MSWDLNFQTSKYSMAKIKKKNKSAVLGKAEPANIDIEEEEKLIKQQQNELRLIADRKQREEEAAVEKNRLVFIDFIGQVLFV